MCKGQNIDVYMISMLPSPLKEVPFALDIWHKFKWLVSGSDNGASIIDEFRKAIEVEILVALSLILPP